MSPAPLEQGPMRLGLWRTAMLAGVIWGLGLIAVDVVDLRVPSATLGMQREVATANFAPTQIRVTSVEPGGPAARAGIVSGDLLSLRDESPVGRMRYLLLRPGQTASLVVTHEGATRTIDLVAEGTPATPSLTTLSFIYEILRCTFIAVAALLVIRRSDALAARMLALFFLLFSICAFGVPSVLPVPFAMVCIFVDTLAIVSVGYAAKFSAIFPTPSVGGPRRFIERWALPIGWTGTGVAAAVNAASIFAGYSSSIAQLIPAISFMVLTVGIIVSFFFANGEAVGEDRQRVQWVSLSLAVGFSGVVVTIAAQVIHPSVARDGILLFLPLTMLAIPIGLGYAMVRHRVLDVGFAINRALVFGGVSAFVVTAMGSLEWFLGKVVLERSHVTSTSLEVAVALGLGYSLRRIHHRIDALVDDVFFRDRHRAEAAMHAFSLDAMHITDLDTLVERAASCVQTNLKATSTHVWLESADGSYGLAAGTSFMLGRLDVDDGVPVRLRSVHEALTMASVQTIAPGVLAVPMYVRGVLTGFITCGAKGNGEGYAPDEIAALVHLTASVGIAVDALRTVALKREFERVVRTAETGGAAAAS